MISADTNLFLYAANPASPRHAGAKQFFGSLPNRQFVVCELVLVEVYMHLRNPAVLSMPQSAREAAGFCKQLKSNPDWKVVDYQEEVADSLWRWASETQSGFRRIIDARLALPLLHHGVTSFATSNVKDFKDFGFERLWDPLVS